MAITFKRNCLDCKLIENKMKEVVKWAGKEITPIT